MLPPPGFISLREAVIRLAELRSPSVDVQNYLRRGDVPVDHADLPVAAKWFAGNRDAFAWPTTQKQIVPSAEDMPQAEGTIVASREPHDPAWLALEAARHELRSAAIEGSLVFSCESEAAALTPVEQRWWRLRGQPYEALQTGSILSPDGQRIWLLLEERSFARWSIPLSQGSRAPSQKAVDDWMIEHTRHGPVTRSAALEACRRQLGARETQARAAWGKLPDEIRGSRGTRKSVAQIGR